MIPQIAPVTSCVVQLIVAHQARAVWYMRIPPVKLEFGKAWVGNKSRCVVRVLLLLCGLHKRLHRLTGGLVGEVCVGLCWWVVRVDAQNEGDQRRSRHDLDLHPRVVLEQHPRLGSVNRFVQPMNRVRVC